MTSDAARAIFASGEEKTVEVLLAQAAENARLQAEMAQLLSGIRGRGRRFCAECFDKQQKIDRLEGEIVNLRQKLHYREKKAEEGYFGSSTPSSKKPVKPNRGVGKPKKKSGAKTGHKGHGRRGFTAETADRIIRVPVPGLSGCGEATEDLGTKRRSVLDLPPIRPEKLLYLLERRRGVATGKEYRAQAPGVLPGWLYGNGLVAQAAGMHYVHGIPMGTVERLLGLPRCSLIDTFHGLAARLDSTLPKLMAEYRFAFVKHADETVWRSQWQSGYAWLFYCENVCLFLFRHTRSGKIPAEVFGQVRLPGVLVVDRYNGYRRVPCKIQFCYEHLKRNLQDLVKKYPDSLELKRFSDHVVPRLKEAIKLRGRRISDAQFYQQAAALKLEIVAAMEADANDEAIRTYQEIFRTHKGKMYHWADDRRVPAHNNTAERELRPTVIARKVSFGSQGDKGRKTREVMASVLNTLALRGSDPAAALKRTLDALAVNPELDPYQLLFGEVPRPDNAEARVNLQAQSSKTSSQSAAPAEPFLSSPPPRYTSHPSFVRTLIIALAFAVTLALSALTPGRIDGGTVPAGPGLSAPEPILGKTPSADASRPTIAVKPYATAAAKIPLRPHLPAALRLRPHSAAPRARDGPPEGLPILEDAGQPECRPRQNSLAVALNLRVSRLIPHAVVRSMRPGDGQEPAAPTKKKGRLAIPATSIPHATAVGIRTLTVREGPSSAPLRSQDR